VEFPRQNAVNAKRWCSSGIGYAHEEGCTPPYSCQVLGQGPDPQARVPMKHLRSVLMAVGVYVEDSRGL